MSSRTFENIASVFRRNSSTSHSLPDQVPDFGCWFWKHSECFLELELLYPHNPPSPPLNICCNLAQRATGWMSGHKKEGKKKETTKECHPVIPSARPGQAKCRKGHESLKSALTVAGPGRSLARRVKPAHISLF